MRTVIIHRADNLNGPWVGQVALQDRGIAQGGMSLKGTGIISFRDYGSVGRIPHFVPVTWEERMACSGRRRVVPDTLNLPASKGLIPIVASDDFL